MKRFFRLSCQAQTTRSRRGAWLWICAAGLGAVAAFAGTGSPGVALGQAPYPPSGQLTDPRAVFYGAPESTYPANAGPVTNRPSPYFDYRTEAPVGGQFDRSQAPAQSPGLGCSPAWGAGSTAPMGQPPYGSMGPTPLGRDGMPFAGTSDPRLGTPYAGSPYFPAGTAYPGTVGLSPAPQNSTGGLQPNFGGSDGLIQPQPNGGPNPGYAGNRDNCVLYTPFVSMAYTGGTTPSTGYNDLFVPLIQNSANMLFADIRGLYNDQAYQGSFGGGLRTRLWDSVILGRYGYYDYRRTEQGNQFQQATVGVELLAWRWETRTNGYIPLANSGSGSGSGSGTAFLQNGIIYLQGTQQSALSGIDGEFGLLVAADPTARKELRAFAGGYYFNGANGGQDIPGVYSRLEARIYDLNMLGEGSRLEMAVIGSYDDVNRYQVTGLFNVRIALGRPTCPCGLSLIERRMLDRVVRRHDIVTSSQSTSTETATATYGDNKDTSVVLVHPGDDLKAVVAAAPSNALIVVDGTGGGTYSVPNGVILNPGQALDGGGSHIQVVGNSTGRTGDLLLPGSRPTIDRPNTLGPVLTMASNTSVVGVDLVGGSSGIFGSSINSLVIDDVNISQTGSDGLQLIDVTGMGMQDVTITQTGGLGMFLQNVNNSYIEDITISHSVGSALYYNCGTNVRMEGLVVDATGITDDAVRFHTQNQAVFSEFDIRNSAFNALTIQSSTVVSFDNIHLTNIHGDGIQAYQSGTFQLSNLAMTYVDGSGLVINDTALVSVNNSVFTDVHNVVSYLNTVHYMSGSGNVSIGQTTLSTGNTNNGGSIQFTQPNATAP